MPRPVLQLLVACAALFAFGTAIAVTVPDLYETTQPVGKSRDAAFVDALRAVVVRVSGQRDAADRLGPALNNAQKYTRSYGLQADGSLQVAFDSVTIDRLLSEANLPIWGRERPATLILLSMDGSDGSQRWVTADSPAAEREPLILVARARGVPIVWPLMDAQDRAQVGAADAGSGQALLSTATRYGANAALLGRARREGTSFHVRWTLYSTDGAAQLAGTPEDGVHLVADTFARVFAAAGSSVGSVTLDVSGISDLNSYAATLNYLEGLTLVRSVALEHVAGDTMRFRVAVRGDGTTLSRAIALDRRLVALGASEASSRDRLTFRYQP